MADAPYQFTYFEQTIMELRNVWSKHAVAPDHVWTRKGDNRTTDSSAFDVQDQRFLRGTAKPGCKLDLRHAAHTKIISDLAALLDFPVPPTTLYKFGGDLPDCPHKKLPGEPWVAISVWPFMSFEEWGDRIIGKMSDAQKASRNPTLNAIWVFDSWISAQEDRGAKHTLVNSVLGDGPVGLGFIDYSFSLSKHWTEIDAKFGAAPWQFPEIPKDEAVVLYAVDKIQALTEGAIKEVVERIDKNCLPNDKQLIIMANLLSRKAKLPEILGLKAPA